MSETLDTGSISEGTAKFYLVKAIAEVAKNLNEFTAFDVWAHVEANPDSFPTFLRSSCNRVLSAAFSVARRADRRICEPKRPYTAVQVSEKSKHATGSRPQRVWVRCSKDS